MSRINLAEVSYERTLRYDKEDLEGIIENYFLVQNPEELLGLLDTLDNQSAIDEILDNAYDEIERVLVNCARIVKPSKGME